MEKGTDNFGCAFIIEKDSKLDTFLDKNYNGITV